MPYTVSFVNRRSCLSSAPHYLESALGPSSCQDRSIPPEQTSLQSQGDCPSDGALIRSIHLPRLDWPTATHTCRRVWSRVESAWRPRGSLPLVMRINRRTVWLSLFAIGVVLVSIVGLSLRAGAQESSNLRTDDATFAAVVEYVDQQRSKLGVPGMAIAIVVGDEVRIATGLGEGSAGRPITANSVFLINSLSKSVTATALMQLVDSGSVDLDAPVGTYVAELSQGEGTVTVREVMHHRSGIPGELYPRPDQHDLGATSEVGPYLEAGADFVYTNLNYDLLALIVERVSGEQFADYVAEKVFGPLSMERSAVGTDRAQELNPTGGHYKWLLLGHRPLDMEVDHGQVGSAAMYSTAHDMANYLIAHMNGGVFEGTRLVSEEAIATLHRAPADRIDGYGGGLFVEPAGSFETPAALAGYKTVWHQGNSETFRSLMWMTLGPDIGMVILANGNDVIDGSWIGQLSDGARLLISGEEPTNVAATADFLTRWSKHIFLAIALIELALVLLVIRTLRTLRRGQPLAAGHWILLATATLIDVGAGILVFVVTPSVAEVPLAIVMEFPDYQILLTGIILLVAWGLIRTILAGLWLSRSQRTDPSSAPNAMSVHH